SSAAAVLDSNIGLRSPLRLNCYHLVYLRRFAARVPGLASGLALAVRPVGSAEVSAREASHGSGVRRSAVCSAARIRRRPRARSTSSPWSTSLLDANYGRVPARGPTGQPSACADAC